MGREVLIKAMVQAIPTYTMGCFKLPIAFCHEIQVLIQKFLWGERGNRRKIQWVKWADLCEPKSKGGIGFKELPLFYDSLLAKQTWSCTIKILCSIKFSSQNSFQIALLWKLRRVEEDLTHGRAYYMEERSFEEGSNGG